MSEESFSKILSVPTVSQQFRPFEKVSDEDFRTMFVQVCTNPSPTFDGGAGKDKMILDFVDEVVTRCKEAKSGEVLRNERPALVDIVAALASVEKPCPGNHLNPRFVEEAIKKVSPAFGGQNNYRF